MYNQYLVFIVNLLICFHVAFSCLQDTRVRKYFKVKSCYRSDATPVGRTSAKSLTECAAYAKERNALAFNFSPPEASKKRRKRPVINCQVLGCPELNNFTSLINDSFFDYYSSYGNFTVLENATCIRSIGVFHLIQAKLNYSEAIEQCQNLFGDLAHILTETRTNSLSKLLSSLSDWYKAAYIGLDDRREEGKYETPLGDPIDCYKYRAWSPGQPRNMLRSDDCVILDNERTWKIVNCKLKMASLCELYPTPPVKLENRFLNVDCDDFDDSDERDLCFEYKRNKRKRKNKRNRCLD